MLAAAADLRVGGWAQVRSSPRPPEVHAVLGVTALAERIAENLRCPPRRQLRDRPEVVVPMHVHHLIRGEIHGDQATLVEHEHQHPRRGDALDDEYKREQRVATYHADRPAPEALVGA